MKQSSRRASIAVAASVLGLLGLAGQRLQVSAQAQSCGTDMRVLVIARSGTEPEFLAVQQALDYPGIPYSVFNVQARHTLDDNGQVAGGLLTPDALASGCHAFYQGVILTTSNATGLTAPELQTLAAFEAAFGARQVTWYTRPTTAFGFTTQEPPATTADLTATLTPAGAQVFSYLNTTATARPISIQHVFTYLSSTAPGDPWITPLLTCVGAGTPGDPCSPDGNTLAAIQTFPDGRQNLAMTFDSNASVLHATLLSYGVVNWVTQGLFVGDRHVYMSPQFDDVFLGNIEWVEGTPCDTSAVADAGGVFRIGAADLASVASWQTAVRGAPITADLRLTMAFNGFGAKPNDGLAEWARQNAAYFYWVSHTWDHTNLDAISYERTGFEIAMNHSAAATLGLAPYSTTFLVQPQVSGLGNPQFLQAAYDNGIQAILSDTSQPTGRNPAPNIGFWNTLGSTDAVSRPLFVVPRRPNNLFFNVAAPADWVAEYNCIYHTNQPFFATPQTYTQILDFISQELLGYLLRGDLDPWMFHQPNLAAYDGVHSLVTDLIDATLAKYSGYFTLPIQSPDIDVLARRMLDRTTARAVGVSATIQPGTGIVLLSPVSVTLPMTGLHLPDAEWYGGQWISWVALEANVPVVLPFTDETVGIRRPIANAGLDQTVECCGTAVTLDGTGSLDPGFAPLTFEWRDSEGTVLGSNAVLPLRLPAGQYVFSLTVRDPRGVGANDDVSVTVTEAVPPALSVPADIRAAATSIAGAVVSYDATAVDAVDGALTPVCSPYSGSAFPIGTTSVGCTARDRAGNVGTASFNVIVEDNTAPDIGPLADVVAEATGPAGAIVSYASPTTLDVVDGPGTADCTPASGGTFAIGTTTIVCSARDAAGNRASSSATVTVRDTTPPAIAATDNVGVEAVTAAGTNVTYLVPATVDAVDGPGTATCLPAAGTRFAIGQTTVACSARDQAGNGSSRSFDVVVTDGTPPVIGIVDSITAEATGPAGAKVTFVPPTSVDAVDGASPAQCVPASGTLFALGSTAVSCVARDAAGNASATGFDVIVRDTTPPTLTMPADLSLRETTVRGEPVTFNVTAVDVVDGNISPTCSPASGSMFPRGTTTVSCSAADRGGSVRTATFAVTVTRGPDGGFDGYGSIDIGGTRGHFSFDVSQWQGRDSGTLEYWSDRPGRGDNYFEATRVTAVVFSDDPAFRSGGSSRGPTVDTVGFTGYGEWNGRSGYTFEARATDQGDSWRHPDTWSLVIKDALGNIVLNVSGPLQSGDIESIGR